MVTSWIQSGDVTDAEPCIPVKQKLSEVSSQSIAPDVAPVQADVVGGGRCGYDVLASCHDQVSYKYGRTNENDVLNYVNFRTETLLPLKIFFSYKSGLNRVSYIIET